MRLSRHAYGSVPAGEGWSAYANLWTVPRSNARHLRR